MMADVLVIPLEATALITGPDDADVEKVKFAEVAFPPASVDMTA